MVATVPPTPADKEMKSKAHLVGDQDAAREEEETDLRRMDQQLQEAVHRAYSGEDAEEAEREVTAFTELDGEQGSDTDADGDYDESEPVGAVKLPDGPNVSDDEEAASEAVDGDDADPLYENENQSDKGDESTSSSRESGVDEDEWVGDSRQHGEGDAGNLVRANCM